MAYHTLEDLINVIPEDIIISLSDDGLLGVVDDQVVNAAIAATDSLVDGYISAQYPVPLAVVPPEVCDLACDITIYKLYKRRQEELSETRRLAYKEAIRLLEQIRDGKHPLNIVAATVSGFSCGVVESSHFGSGNA
jgi:phage gp36-like protein